MKIALIMHGLSKSLTRYSPHPNRGWDVPVVASIDYKNSLQNYYDHLFSVADVDVYFHTYQNEKLNESTIKEDYQPESYIVTPEVVPSKTVNKSSRTNSRKNSILKSIECFKNNFDYDAEFENKYDCVMITRFDLHFEKSIPKLLQNSVPKSEIGVSFQCEETAPDGFVDDNFFFFHPRKLRDFEEIVRYLFKNNNSRNMHMFANVGREEFDETFSYLYEGHYNINVDNPFYHIVRLISEDGDNWRYVSSPNNNKVTNCTYCG